MTNFQREGAASNAWVGREFESRAKSILSEYGVEVEENFRI